MVVSTLWLGRTLPSMKLSEGSWARATTTAWIVMALFGCTRTERPDASKRATANPPATPRTCGNGAQDSGEACDFNVEYEDGCPEGWGICWECDQTCQGFRLHVVDEEWGACTVRVNGRSYSRREYDALGRNVLLEVDTDYDGDFDQVARAAFDEKGRQLFWERYGEGRRLEERTDFRHDAQGRVVSMLVNANGDGTADTRWSYSYDSRGNPTQQDRFVGETLQERIHNRFDAAGRQTSWTRDANGDGSPDERKRYTYDPNGNMISYESDLDGDGLFEDVRQYQYDMRGNAIVDERVEMPDGRVVERSRMTYDERGNRTSWLKDSHDDGRVNERFLYVYDARGNLTSFEHDMDGDGTIDMRERRFYDREGKLVRQRRTDPSGTWQTTNDYGCLAKTIPNAPRRRTKAHKLQPASSGE
jgi:hypothetical protein